MNNQMKITDKKIIITKEVNLPIQRAYELWSTTKGTSELFQTETDIELTPFGKYEIYFILDGNEGERGSETSKVLSFVPNEMISFTWNAPPSYPYVRNHSYQTHVIIRFYKLNDSKTKVELIHHAWPEGDAWDQVFDYFTKAWEFVMTNMTKIKE
ncbi:MAG: hypothetical protein CVV57_09000 [Tenericutes bacterium HGW-Tenericutes-2]|jgi:uncharacterized protein YndB with AHSA1/START domain|nr:MAG: hypothetical protein CVV57_09000 [Tenericutes bacterium HGW-Tenericutes-2]